MLPVVARAPESADREVRRQGVVALAHIARLHRTVDRRCRELLPRCLPGHRELPLRPCRHHLWERLVERLRRPFG
ncbi:hypothetical protein ACIPYQ_34575 [Streptomyces sp. NPDC090045]|uniref:hypothetical protein n=1 Tax=Streptomyces sp. NPDC090045 TaxID=3365927 RepID=UPI003823083C